MTAQTKRLPLDHQESTFSSASVHGGFADSPAGSPVRDHPLSLMIPVTNNNNSSNSPDEIQHSKKCVQLSAPAESSGSSSTNNSKDANSNSNNGNDNNKNKSNNAGGEADTTDLEEDPAFTTTSFLRPYHFPPRHSFLSITLHLKDQAISASFTQTVTMLAQTIALSSVGRSHPTSVLASCGIGISAFNVLSLSIANGWSSAIDTLASRAYGRLQKNAAAEEEVGEITQLGMGLGLILSLTLGSIVVAFCRPIVAGVFGAEYVDGASEFLVNAFPFLILYTICIALYKSLQAQHLAEIPSRASVFGVFATFVSSIAIIPPFGIKGVAWTLAISSVVQIIATLHLAPANALFRKVPWFPPQHWRSIFTRDRIVEYVKIAIPTMLSVSAEWWAFEILNILVAHLGQQATAAFGVFFNIAVFCWCLTSGVSVACYSHVGKLLGEGKPMLAVVFARTAVIWSWLISVGNCVLLSIFHDFVFSLYTHDEQLKTQLRGTIFLFWLYHQCDALQYVLQSPFRAASRQDETVQPVLFSLWLIGLPSAYLFTHHIDGSLHSLLLGFCVGFFFEIPLLVRKIRQWDWNQLAKEASRKKHEEQEEEDEAAATAVVEAVVVRNDHGEDKDHNEEDEEMKEGNTTNDKVLRTEELAKQQVVAKSSSEIEESNENFKN